MYSLLSESQTAHNWTLFDLYCAPKNVLNVHTTSAPTNVMEKIKVQNNPQYISVYVIY